MITKPAETLFRYLLKLIIFFLVFRNLTCAIILRIPIYGKYNECLIVEFMRHLWINILNKISYSITILDK